MLRPHNLSSANNFFIKLNKKTKPYGPQTTQKSRKRFISIKTQTENHLNNTCKQNQLLINNMPNGEL